MGKPIKRNPIFHVSSFPRKVIGKGTQLNVKRIAGSVSVKGTTKAKAIARQKRLKVVSGYTIEDFVAAHGRPDIVGSEGFLSWEPKTVIEKGKTKRIIFIGGVAVPKQHRRKGNRVELHQELLKLIYKKYGLLVREGLFIQTQISSADSQALSTLTKRLGYAIFSRMKTGKQEIIVLRKQLDSKEMQQILKKK
jgi:hypothetical protein